MAENKAKEIRLEEIINAGIVCFAAKGYTATSVSEICREAGITKGGFYWHFKSKSDLLQAVMDHQCTLQEEQWRGLATIEISKESIKGAGSAFIQASLSSPEIIRLKAMLEVESLRDKDILVTLVNSQNWVLNQLKEFSLKVLETYPAVRMDAESMARLFNMVVCGIVHDQFLLDSHMSGEEVWNCFVDSLIP